MRVAVVQHDIVWEDAAATIARVTPQVAAAADAGAELVLLTETYATGFTGRFAASAEPMDGPSVTFLEQSAVRHGVWVGGSVMVMEDGSSRPSNTFVLAGPSGQSHRYRKVHTSFFDDEKAQVEPGDAIVTVTVGDLRCTLLTCYDLRFADIFWEAAPQSDCYLLVANWPALRQGHWEALLRARAIENQAYVIATNRVGTDGQGAVFAGGSRVIDPWGDVIALAGETEELLLAEVQRHTVDETRRRFPFLEHRRDREQR